MLRLNATLFFPLDFWLTNLIGWWYLRFRRTATRRKKQKDKLMTTSYNQIMHFLAVAALWCSSTHGENPSRGFFRARRAI